LRPSRAKYAAFAALSLTLIGAGVVMIRAGDAFGWLAIAAFLPIAALFVALLLPGSARLELDRDGFAVTALFRTHRVAWTGTGGFRTIRTVGLFRGVVYDLPSGAVSVPAWAGAIAGPPAGMMPDTYGMTPDDLAALMNGWRAHSIDARREPQRPAG